MIIDETKAVVLDTNMILAFFEGDPIEDLDEALDKAATKVAEEEEDEVFILIRVVAPQDDE